MRFRKPELIPLLFIIAAVALFSAIGAWQVKRLAWKTHLLAHISRQQALPALGTLPQNLSGLDYRNVKLTGIFLYNHTLRRAGGMQYEDPGFFLLTPFRLEDDGRIILVDRGFAPDGKAATPPGAQTVAGVIRPLAERRIFSPDNAPGKNIWFYEDIPAMSKATGLALEPLMVEAVGERERGVYPIPSDGAIFIRDDHLQYAITWFALALIALVMFGLYYRMPQKRVG
ncbi:MAG: hypothetical protein KGI29_01185 [Pseudomonadota bacterium]|nr:hypothetical protein [Pseudomonadota bacterium]MDE3037695.1 hypothetical protein [Pseudomonadota bacterium]